ncbi:MAG: SGNH/GDSL hydrolase family protein [bacterium]|nr:SGNH/GDSL hydrolase family protein [bacterium]
MALRIRRIWLIRLALLLAPILIACVGFEIALRRVFPASGITPYRTGTFEGVHAELRPSFDTLYKGVDLHINADGFRGPELVPPRSDKVRVAMIGDSFTFGTGVPYEDTLAACLEAELTKAGHDVAVLDFGVPGYNAPNVLAQLEHKVLALEPAVVIYTFFANDVAPSEKRVPIAPDATIDDLGAFPLRSTLLQFVGVRVKDRLRRMGLFANPGYIATELDQFQSAGRERVRTATAAMAAACTANEIEFFTLCYPFLTHPDKNPYAYVDRAFIADCAEIGVDCHHVLDAFPNHGSLGQLWVNPFDSHPNGLANRVVAAWVTDRVVAALEVQSER